MIFKMISALVLVMPCTGAWDFELDSAGSYSFDYGDSDDHGSDSTQSIFYSEQLNDGDTVGLLSHGPFTLIAACTAIDGDADVKPRLIMTVEAGSQSDEWVYGSPDYISTGDYECVGITTAGTTSDTCVVWSVGSGTGFGGAFSSLSGYYVGFGGSRAIGFSKDYLSDADTLQYHDGYTPDEVAAFPVDCAMSGEITYNL